LAALIGLACVVSATGLPVLVFQAYGWLRMYETYREALPAGEAFEATFSGSELCEICLAVDDMQSAIDRSVETYLASGFKTLLLPLTGGAVAVAAPARGGTSPFAYAFRNGKVFLDTATPPPRRVWA